MYIDNKFRKQERLCSIIAIQQLFKDGKSIYQYPFRLVYKLKEYDSYSLKIALTVPKRNFKRAVKRNYLKRRMREAFRLNKEIICKSLTDSYSLDIIVIFTATQIMEYHEMESKFCILLQKFAKNIERDINISASAND